MNRNTFMKKEPTLREHLQRCGRVKSAAKAASSARNLLKARIAKAAKSKVTLKESVLEETPSTYGAAGDGIDLPLLMDSLAMSSWERMQANDDALNFGESLRAAMIKRNEKSK